jgi:tRNA(His) 5'-end guanylyltransferase
MASVSASILTAEFNKWRLIRQINAATRDAEIVNWHKIAYFDSRVFTIPDRTEVMNYFVWRNQDCSRNSVSMVAQSKFSHNELQGKSTPQMHEMLHGIGVNWATDYSDGDKNGRLIVKEDYISEVPGWGGVLSFNAERTHWVSKGAWKFTENKEKLLTMIPKYEI